MRAVFHSGPSQSPVRSDNQGSRAGLTVLPLCCLALLLTGCAIHYGNARNGHEIAWGVGRVAWEVETLTNDWMVVSSGMRLPGIVLGVGPDFLGLTLGYQVRERMQIVPAGNRPRPNARINGRDLAPDMGERWAIGQLNLHPPASSGIFVVRGKAAAGLSLALEHSRPSALIGRHSHQLTTVSGRDVLVELAGGTKAWPHFDFPSMRVAVVADTNQIERSIAP